MTLSPQNFAKSLTHQKSPFSDGSILRNRLLVHSSPPVHKTSNIPTNNKGMFMKSLTKKINTYTDDFKTYFIISISSQHAMDRNLNLRHNS